MKARFYTVVNEKNRFTKAGSGIGSPSINVDVNLLDENDFINPTITVVLTDKNILNCNYTYLEKPFYRYYFIESITTESFNVYTLSLHVDVLNTFRKGIYKYEAVISRSEHVYDPYIVDDSLPVKNKHLYQYRTISSFSPNPTLEPILNNYVICLSTGGDKYNNPTLQLKPNIIYNTALNNMCVAFCCGYDDVCRFSNFMLHPERMQNLFKTLFEMDVTQGIISIKRYPFDIKSKYGFNGGIGTDKVGIFPDEIDADDPKGYLIYSNNLGVASEGDFIIEGDSFLDFEPFSRYVLKIPFVGDVELIGDQVINEPLHIFSSLDVIQGMLEFNITTGGPYSIGDVVSVSGFIGEDLPISRSGTIEAIRNNIQSGINLAMDVASMFIPAVGVTESITKTVSSPFIKKTQKLPKGKQRMITTSKTEFTGSSVEKTRESRNKYYDRHLPRLPSYQTPLLRTGSVGSINNSYCKSTDIRLVSVKPIIPEFNMDSYAHQYGRPLCVIDYIGAKDENDELKYKGFLMVDEVHCFPISNYGKLFPLDVDSLGFDNDQGQPEDLIVASNEELDEIEQLLTEGVYLT